MLTITFSPFNSDTCNYGDIMELKFIKAISGCMENDCNLPAHNNLYPHETYWQPRFLIDPHV